MSAPDVNVKKQQRRHKGPLIGIGAVLAVVAVLFVLFLAGVLSPEATGVEGLVDGEPSAPIVD